MWFLVEDFVVRRPACCAMSGTDLADATSRSLPPRRGVIRRSQATTLAERRQVPSPLAATPCPVLTYGSPLSP
eukprot:3201142-Rhodomonas_salina.1